VKPTQIGVGFVFRGVLEEVLSMLVSECKECGERYYGWALQATEHQYCTKCGAVLVVCNEADDSRLEPKDSLSVYNNSSNDRKLPHIIYDNQYVDFETEFKHWLKY
jgi:hypothetical protein